MRILFVGDIVGNPGRRGISGLLKKVVSEHKIEFTIANGENAAGGMGITPVIALDLFQLGIQVITSGNHIWAKKEIIPYLDQDDRLLRPANYPAQVPGRGSGIFELAGGVKVAVLNLEGRVFMRNLDCPFRVADREIEVLKEETRIIVIDFHAEATSEKAALGRYLNGRVSAVLGTHTHVQTSDERILDHGTAYITDAGMTGPSDSVIGVREKVAIERFLTQIPLKYDVATEEVELQGVVLDVDPKTGRAQDIRRLRVSLNERS
jgi:2',3'-cyclic-nucleotide 2'-phosphodiesterase